MTWVNVNDIRREIIKTMNRRYSTRIGGPRLYDSDIGRETIELAVRRLYD